MRLFAPLMYTTAQLQSSPAPNPHRILKNGSSDICVGEVANPEKLDIKVVVIMVFIDFSVHYFDFVAAIYFRNENFAIQI